MQMNSEKADSGDGELDIDEHLLTIEEVTKRYGTHINVETPCESQGIPADKAKELKAINGPNLLSPAKSTPPILIFFSCLIS